MTKYKETPFPTCDAFDAVAKSGKEILLYGMGNGADKLLSHLAARHIPVAGVFASDGFVRGQFFHGMRVLSFSEVSARFSAEETLVLLAFGSARPDVIENIERVAAAYPLLVPDLPVCGDGLFDTALLNANQEKIAAARALLEDDASRALFDTVIQAKRTGRLDLLLAAVSEKTPFGYLATSPRPIRRMGDFGAYTGDSAREAMERFPLSHILAVEPDRRNFKKLAAWGETLDVGLLECHRAAIHDGVGEMAFDASGNRNAGLCTGKTSENVPTVTVDALVAGRQIDYLKFDIEGAEKKGLLGAKETIARERPALRVALYHRVSDLFTLPLLLSSIAPHYRFYLTRARSLPAWDLDLIAVATP